jgi:hypothetical protein
MTRAGAKKWSLANGIITLRYGAINASRRPCRGLRRADRNPPAFDPATSSVRMPGGFKKSFAAFTDADSAGLAVG